MKSGRATASVLLHRLREAEDDEEQSEMIEALRTKAGRQGFD
ncbi:MAG TPA: hypothetical protein VGC89_21600 [Pyrinomonadaceae bacterium]